MRGRSHLIARLKRFESSTLTTRSCCPSKCLLRTRKYIYSKFEIRRRRLCHLTPKQTTPRCVCANIYREMRYICKSKATKVTPTRPPQPEHRRHLKVGHLVTTTPGTQLAVKHFDARSSLEGKETFLYTFIRDNPKTSPLSSVNHSSPNAPSRASVRLLAAFFVHDVLSLMDFRGASSLQGRSSTSPTHI